MADLWSNRPFCSNDLMISLEHKNSRWSVYTLVVFQLFWESSGHSDRTTKFAERLRLVLADNCSSKHRSTYYLSCEPIIFNKIWQVCRIFSPLPWIVHVVQNVCSAGKSFITFLRNCGLELFLAATALLLGKNRIEVNNQQINWSKGCIFYSDISLKCTSTSLLNYWDPWSPFILIISCSYYIIHSFNLTIDVF